MSKKLFAFIAALAIAGASATVQAAPLVRVSGKGADGAGCGTAAAPCRTLQAAHDQVDAGGYIVALDPADFGFVVITKSLTIVGDGGARARTSVHYAGTVYVRASLDSVVRLQGLSIEANSGYAALTVESGGRLEVKDCSIRNPIGFAVSTYFEPRSLAFENTTFADSAVGLSGFVHRSFYGEGLSFSGNRNSGLALRAVTKWVAPVVIKNSRAVIQPASAEPNTGAFDFGYLRAVLKNVEVSGYPYGVSAERPVWLKHTTVTGNGSALSNAYPDVRFLSAGDNIVRGNTDDTLGLLTPAALH